MANYKYDNPDDAYKEAQQLIKKAKEKSLRTLRLIGLGLTVVPPELGQLNLLNRLELHNNRLAIYPSEINQLAKLTRLQLQNNNLTILPYLSLEFSQS